MKGQWKKIIATDFMMLSNWTCLFIKSNLWAIFIHSSKPDGPHTILLTSVKHQATECELAFEDEVIDFMVF